MLNPVSLQEDGSSQASSVVILFPGHQTGVHTSTAACLVYSHRCHVWMEVLGPQAQCHGTTALRTIPIPGVLQSPHLQQR